MAYFVRIKDSAMDFLDNFDYTLDKFATIVSTVPKWCIKFESDECVFTFEILPKIEGDYESIIAGYELCKDEYMNEDKYKEHELLPLSETFKPLGRYDINGECFTFTSYEDIDLYWNTKQIFKYNSN